MLDAPQVRDKNPAGEKAQYIVTSDRIHHDEDIVLVLCVGC